MAGLFKLTDVILIEPTIRNFIPKDINVCVAVGSSVFMVEPNPMHQFVHDGSSLIRITAGWKSDSMCSFAFIVTKARWITTETVGCKTILTDRSIAVNCNKISFYVILFSVKSVDLDVVLLVGSRNKPDAGVLVVVVHGVTYGAPGLVIWLRHIPLIIKIQKEKRIRKWEVYTKCGVDDVRNFTWIGPLFVYVSILIR
jgi:hypothetical protein